MAVFKAAPAADNVCQVWDRSTTSDSLLGTARVPIAENLGDTDRNGWHRLVGAGDQVKVEVPLERAFFPMGAVFDSVFAGCLASFIGGVFFLAIPPPPPPQIK